MTATIHFIVSATYSPSLSGSTPLTSRGINGYCSHNLYHHHNLVVVFVASESLIGAMVKVVHHCMSEFRAQLLL